MIQWRRSLNLIRRCRQPITDQHCSSLCSIDPPVHSSRRLFHESWFCLSPDFHCYTSSSHRYGDWSLDISVANVRTRVDDAIRERKIEFRTLYSTTMRRCGVRRLSGPAAERRRRLRRNFAANWAVADRPLRAAASRPGERPGSASGARWAVADCRRVAGPSPPRHRPRRRWQHQQRQQ